MKMLCEKCNKEYNDDYRFCPSCGNHLVKAKGRVLLEQLGEDYRSVKGTWKVTTEGDCEGRTTRDLGIYEGYIDDIALSLANQCYYSLHFTRSNVKKASIYNKGKVNVTLDIKSHTWDMSPEDRVETMKELFKDRNVEIEAGNSYASFVIKSK